MTSIPSDPSASSGPEAPGTRDVGVAIPAAGSGARMGGTKKAFLEVGGRPLLERTLRPFLAHPDVVSIGIAVPAEDLGALPAWLTGMDPRIRIVAGGGTRLHSVRAALSALRPEVRTVLVHDAARPLVSREIIDRCLRVARTGEGAVAGWPVIDTLKEVAPDGRVVSTPDRESMWRAQTPQAFPREALLEAYRQAVEDGAAATDDAALFARSGGRVRMVEGAAWNLKVTYPEDVAVAELFLERAERRFRLLFVCTGNTCRSPIAELLARAQAASRGWERIEVRSAGVAAYPGAPASDGALEAAVRKGMDLSAHRSAPLSEELLEWADLILTMSASHLEVVHRAGGGDRAGLLSSFSSRGSLHPEPGERGVADPFGGDAEAYEVTWRELEELISGLLDRLADSLEP
ncbi:MAG: 2-C-methyl-D-erythritol 4-phosphate cytidylyltransferase [Gemmatimonadales bacterium]|nr:MAG: 2-C-methyl-D-erythritol 4-phosphate cytidylyltransferase [Gemmatimonadales bacterium]